MYKMANIHICGTDCYRSWHFT